MSAIAAVGSALYSRRTARIETKRRHEEEAPKFSAQFDLRRLDDSRSEEVEVVAFSFLAGPEQLDDVEVELVTRNDGVAPPLIGIGLISKEVVDSKASLTHYGNAHMPFLRGQERIVLAKRHPNEGGGVVPFTLRCRRGRKEWPVTVYCDVHPVPMIY